MMDDCSSATRHGCVMRAIGLIVGKGVSFVYDVTTVAVEFRGSGRRLSRKKIQEVGSLRAEKRKRIQLGEILTAD